MWVQKPGPLQEQQVILAAEPSLQPSNWYFEEKHGDNQQSQRVREGSFQTGTNRLAVYKTCLFTWVAEVNTTCVMELTQEGPLNRVHTTL